MFENLTSLNLMLFSFKIYSTWLFIRLSPGMLILCITITEYSIFLIRNIYGYPIYTVVTKLKRNNLRLRSFFEIEMPLWRRRQSFHFNLVTTVYIMHPIQYIYLIKVYILFTIYNLLYLYLVVFMISNIYIKYDKDMELV